MDRNHSREKSRSDHKRGSGRVEKKKEKFKDFSPDPYYERSSSKKKQTIEKSFSKDKYAVDPKYHDEKYQNYDRSHKYEQDYTPVSDAKSSKGSKRKQLTPQSRDSRSPNMQPKHDHKRSRYHSPSPKSNKIENVERGRSREKKQKKLKIENYEDSYEQGYHSQKKYHEKVEIREKKYHNTKEHPKQHKDYDTDEPRKKYDDNFQYDDRKYQKPKEFYQDYRDKKQYKAEKYIEPQQKFYKEPKDAQKEYHYASSEKKFKDVKNYDAEKYYKDDYAKKSFRDDQYVEPQDRRNADIYEQPKKNLKEFKKRGEYFEDIDRPQKHYKTKDSYSQQKYEKSFPEKRQPEYYGNDPPKKGYDKQSKAYGDQKYYKDDQYDKQYYKDEKHFASEKKYFDDPDKYESHKKHGKDYQERYDDPPYSKSKVYDENRSSTSKKSQYYSPHRESYSGSESIQTSHSHKSAHKREKAVYSDHYSDKEERITKKNKKIDGEKLKKKHKVEVDEELYLKSSHKQGEVKKKRKENASYSSDEFVDDPKHESKQKTSRAQKNTSGGESENERKKLKVKKKKKQKEDEVVIASPPKKKSKEIIEEEVKDKKKTKKRKRAREFSSQSFSDNELPVKIKKTKHVEKNDEEWETVDVILDSPPAKPAKKKKSKDLSPSRHHQRANDDYVDSRREGSYDLKSSRSSSQNRHYGASVTKQHHKEVKQDHPRDKYQDQRSLEDEQRLRGPPRPNPRPIHEAPRQHDNYKPNYKESKNFDDQFRDRPYKLNDRINVDRRSDSERGFEPKAPHYPKNADPNRYSDKQGEVLYKNRGREPRNQGYEEQRFSDNGRNAAPIRREFPRNKEFQQDRPRPHNNRRDDWQSEKRQPRFEEEEGRDRRGDWKTHGNKNQQHPFPKLDYNQDARMTSWKGSELRIKAQSGRNQREKWASPPSGVASESSKYSGNFQNLPPERNRFPSEQSSPSSFPTYREVRNRSGDHRNIDLGLEVTIRDDATRGRDQENNRSPARMVSSYKTNQKARKPFQGTSDPDSKKQDYKTPANRYQQRTQNNVPLGRPHSHDRNPRKFPPKLNNFRGRLDIRGRKQERSRSGSDRDRSHASTTSRSSTRSPRRQKRQRLDHGSRKHPRRSEKDAKLSSAKNKTTSNDFAPKEQITEAADVLDVDWKELASTKDKEEIVVQEDTSILQRFTPGNLLLRMGVSTDLLPPELVEKVKRVCENEKKSITNNHLELVLDKGLGALNRNAALSRQSWVNSFTPKSKIVRLTAYADAEYRCKILGISTRDLKYPIQPPQVINARTYAASLKYYANKMKLPVPVQ